MVCVACNRELNLIVVVNVILLGVIPIAGKTIAEKIFSAHSGTDAHAGDIVVANIDYAMSQDGTSALAIDAIASMGADTVFDPAKVAMVMDHSCPSPLEGVSAIHAKIRDFGARTGIRVYDWGAGVCHQLLPESGNIVAGDLVVGCDSHTCTYGALNVFSTGVGSTDGAAAMVAGKLWFKVPETIRVNFNGVLPNGVFSKDLILHLAGLIGVDGATYQALEFAGPVIDALSIDARMTISNMAIEVGAKAGLMCADDKTLDFFEKRALRNGTPLSRTPLPVAPDADATYAQTIDIDTSTLVPMVAKPHAVGNVVPIDDVQGVPVAEGVIGTCTNGRLEDFAIAASILNGRKINSGCRLVVAPASRDIYLDAMAAGYIQTLVEAGACVVTPGCGPCVGTHNGVPSDAENVISTANRNFKGRMGNSNAFIYLGSPATVAASMINGEICDPRRYL
ncbi:MAG: 3-isopropylmalate dehydratase large subunit [Coriobacteriales bacterium]|jgi:3-isopropylmalate/(R)-2-methylmalate dehydratase large subunit|nr:3-isopropylmalate dehydratase large subunit [Coriobacteriales bacterium]